MPKHNQARGGTIRQEIRVCQIPRKRPCRALSEASLGTRGAPARYAYAFPFVRPAALRDVRPAPPVFFDQDLRAHNTLGLPSRAAVAVLDDESALPALREALAAGRNGPKGQAGGAPLFILGGGSNVVVQARPHHRVLSVALRGIRLWDETADHWIIEAAAGEPWHGFVDHCLSQGWPGLENLALIPGTVGAAPVQNIGAYGLELDQRLHSVVAWDLQAGREQMLRPGRVRLCLSRQPVQARRGRALADRAGAFCAVQGLGAASGLSRLAGPSGIAGQRHGPRATPSPRQVFDAVCGIRRRKLPDPAVLGNAGSFFKNPVIDATQADRLKRQFPDLRAYPQADGRIKLAAGWLIEQAGWKGRRLGSVGMHERQALVLVNHGGAQAVDVLALAQAVRVDVQARFGVDLEQEPGPRLSRAGQSVV